MFVLFFIKKGFRFRLHDKKLPGKPDIVMNKYKTAVFVDGCYWHRHKVVSSLTTLNLDRNSGNQNLKAMCVETKKLIDSLKILIGKLFEYGSVK